MSTLEQNNPNRKIILNRIRTPDGTIMTSKSRHDYRTYKDKNGLTYMVDGGNAYLRRNVHFEAPYEEASLYTDDDHAVLRKEITWGRREADGSTSPIAIKNMSRAHINNIRNDGYSGMYVALMQAEIVWRDDHETVSEAKRLEIEREDSYG